MPPFFDLRARGMSVEEASFARKHMCDALHEQLRYWKDKPSGSRLGYIEETRYFEEIDQTPVHRIDSQAPTGVSYSTFLKSQVARSVSVITRDVMKIIGRKPTCALAEASIAHSLDGPRLWRPSPSKKMEFWRQSIGKYSRSIDVHVEPDCVPPYLLPAGELWLMLAWRYDLPEERRTEWAKPVGIIRFDEYADPDMVHIAKCSRTFQSPLDVGIQHRRREQ